MSKSIYILAACALIFCSCAFRVERDPDVLVDTLAADPQTLNPVLSREISSYSVNKYIYESLLERDNATLELIPRLAEKWEVSPDHLAYTFWMRKGVKWHDGREFTADDVVYTFERIRDPSVDAYAKGFLSDVKEVEKIAHDEVRVTYSRPYFKALEILGSVMIVPKHVFASGADLSTNRANRKPIGTGPYRFVEWKTGRQIELSRFDNYWGEKPKITGISFYIIPDRTVSFELLKKGAIDLDSLRAIQWDRQTKGKPFDEKFMKLKYYLPNSSFIGWNMRRPFFSDRRVRIAMTMFVNRGAIIEKLLFGQGAETSSNVYRFGPFYDDSIKPYPYDPKKAAELLDEAGWSDHDGDGLRDKDGVPFKFTLMYPAGAKLSRSLGLILREELFKAGVEMNVLKLEWATMIDLIAKRNFDAVSIGMTAALDQDLYPLWHSSQADKGVNYFGFANERADRLLEEARVEFDAAGRAVLYREVQKILHEEEPCTFLFTEASLVAVAKRFENVKEYRLGLDLLEWKIGPWPVLYEW